MQWLIANWIRQFLFGCLLVGCSSTRVAADRCPASQGAMCASLYLSERGAAHSPASAPAEFFRRGSLKAEPTNIHWNTAVLRPGTVAQIERVNALVDQLMDPESSLNREVASYQQDLTQKGDAAFWNTYFKMYDGILQFCDGYLHIFVQADHWLPTQGSIVDYGFGTGNGATSLILLAPQRQMSGIDFSSTGAARAKKKLSQAVDQVEGRPADLRVGDLLHSQWPEASFDGALMNNVLYAIEPRDRLTLLKKIRADLKPGGRFVLSDPAPELKSDRQAVRRLLLDVFHSSVRNGSAVTEFDLAYFGYLNMKFLMGDGNFLSRDELQDLAIQAGFEVLHHEASYYGAANLLVLQRPPH